MADVDLTTAIETNATTAKSVTTRDGSVSAHDLQAQIAAAQYLAANASAGDAFSALRPRKMVPPSPIGSALGRGH